MSNAILSRAALLMPYSTECRWPRVPNDEMLTIRPLPCGTMIFAASTQAT